MEHNELFFEKLDAFDWCYESEDEIEWEDGMTLAEYDALRHSRLVNPW